ncbi:MAG: hypothetical protein ABH803_02890 [Candidatus Micrarchaeota archaeon]
MKRSHGGFSKHSRNLTARNTTVSRILSVFKPGENVRINVNQRFLRGRLEALRFNHRIGVVEGKQGRALVLKVMDGRKPKTIIVSSVHVERF